MDELVAWSRHHDAAVSFDVNSWDRLTPDSSSFHAVTRKMNADAAAAIAAAVGSS